MKKEIITALRSLDLSDGGSHSRLSAIASCFLEPAFGWTRGACETLRDRLIEIMENKDGNDDNDNSDGCNRNHHRCNQRQVSYDELGNERHKAVCALRKLDGCSPLAHNFREALAAAINVPRDGAPYDDKQLCHLICDRLIHLLGGDQPTLSDLYGILQDGAESENRGSESTRKMTKSTEIGESGVDSTSYQSHCSSLTRLENETRITDELREYLDKYGQEYDNYKGEMIGSISGGLSSIYAIADRIDEHVSQLEHVMEMWRDRAEDMRMERDELQEKNRHLAQKCDTMLVFLSNRAMNTTSDQEQRIEKLVRQRDELRVKLKEIGDIANG